ncbi:hypothetical protein IJO12_04970 [bacterium]|nr:hypothetical protein [bacterium]
MMFPEIAGMFMAMKIYFTQLSYPLEKSRNRQIAEMIYENEVKKLEETEKYEKANLPESGYMTVAEYEAQSRAKSKHEIEVPNAEIPKDSNMVYVPQKRYKLVKYNEPAGSVELNIPRRLNFDRQINAQGIISGDRKMLVYPAIYYYAEADCTSCDLFLINLEAEYNDVQKAMRANIVKKDDVPLISTDKSIDKKFVFRTLTPIDFSPDNTKLVVKEKIGHRHDGIWKTELWVYDFSTKSAKVYPQVRDAIVEYWEDNGISDLNDNRWDIYPMGFDANNDNRIILSAYAFTGEAPKFLGIWSIDVLGETTKLETMDEAAVPVSVIGYKLEQENTVMELSEIEFEAKQANKLEKAKQKKIDKEEKAQKKLREIEYKRKKNQMDLDTMIRIKNYKQNQKNLKKQRAPKTFQTS